MNILLATYWPFPHIGGVSTYLGILRTRLEEVGHRVEILAQHPDLLQYYLVGNGQLLEKQTFRTQAEAEVKANYESRNLPYSPWLLWRESEKYAFELAFRQISLQNYDLVHTQDIISTFVCRRAKPSHVPLVATIHGCLAAEWMANDEILVRSPLERHYLSLEEYFGSMSSDCLILPSQWLSDKLSTFGIEHPCSYIIPYGLDQDIYENYLVSIERQGLTVSSLEKKSIIIACPARLVAIKGHGYLLEAMRLLAKQHENVVCWLIGDGVMRQDLERQVEELKLQNHVYFWGKRHDVPELIAKADIVVLPSLQDNLPFSIIEAQSLGKPVVSSCIGGIVEMVEDGRNGFLVEPANAIDLFEKLLLLVEDRDLRSKMAVAAREHALAVWNDKVMLRQTLEVYKKAVSAQSFPVQIQDFTSSLIAGYLADEGEIAQPSSPLAATLSGKIADGQTGRAAAHAHIHLLDMAGVVLLSTTSGPEGTFEIRNLQQGNYELGISAMALGMKTFKISVNSSEPIKLDVII
ncbi:glycosyltransferase [Paenibacillus puldeungensis]|uniref:Glycosyltransferase n=1 Tax=Paenibacillus puldeungensis TaxID=696536 RepID=A0ABW3S182_9BACL